MTSSTNECSCQRRDGTILLTELTEEDVTVGMKKLASENWMRQYSCQICGQTWVVDTWEKGRYQFAFKTQSTIDLKTWDSTPLRKAYLLKSRGGLENEKCIYADCKDQRVKDVFLCLNHLYATGVQR